MIKRDYGYKQEINTETYLKKKKKKRICKKKCRNMSEEEKKRLNEYQKNYRKAKKSQYNNV